MAELLPPWSLFSAFLAASILLAVTPGPVVFYVIMRSLTQGRRSGVASALGGALGNFCNAVGASVGLAALFKVSSIAFTFVKLAGAVYLIILGVRAILESGTRLEAAEIQLQSLSRIFRDGFFVGLLNPKITLFFAAFLPQFMTAERASLAQSLTLGAVFVLIAMMTDSVYAVFAARASVYLRTASTAKPVGRYALGGALIGLGLFTAFSSHDRS